MADINIERKRKSPLPWIIGLVVLALLALLLLRSCSDDEVDEGTVVVTDTTTATMVTDTTMAPMATAPMDTGAMAAGGAGAGTGWIAGVLAGTATGGASGEAMVPSTPSDRGFWVEENGQRVFAVLAEPSEQLRDIDPGQRVRITNARVLRGSEITQIPQDVEAETRTTAQGQQYFLLVPAASVEVIAGGNTTAN